MIEVIKTLKNYHEITFPHGKEGLILSMSVFEEASTDKGMTLEAYLNGLTGITDQAHLFWYAIKKVKSASGQEMEMNKEMLATMIEHMEQSEYERLCECIVNVTVFGKKIMDFGNDASKKKKPSLRAGKK
jgi:hypothetical protein